MLPLFYIFLTVPIKILRNSYSTYISVYLLVETIMAHHIHHFATNYLYNFTPLSTHKKTNLRAHSHVRGPQYSHLIPSNMNCISFNMGPIFLLVAHLHLHIYPHFCIVIMTITDEASLYIIMYSHTYTHIAQPTYISIKPQPNFLNHHLIYPSNRVCFPPFETPALC